MCPFKGAYLRKPFFYLEYFHSFNPPDCVKGLYPCGRTLVANMSGRMPQPS